MGGIKGTILLLAILGGSVTLYLKSSLSTEPPAVMKAEVVPERGPEQVRAAPARIDQAPSRPVDIVPRQAALEPQQAAEPPRAERVEAQAEPRPTDDAKARKKITEFRARERVLAGRLKVQCDSGKEKRRDVCAHAERLLRSAPRHGKNPAGK